GPGEAFAMGPIRVVGRTELSDQETLVFTDDPEAVHRALRQGLELGSDGLRALAALAEKTDSLTASRLMGSLAAGPRLAERAVGLAGLAERAGPTVAAQLWGEVERLSLTDNPGLASLALRLASAGDQQPDVGQVAALMGALSAHPLDGRAVTALEKLADLVPAAKAEGTWYRSGYPAWVSRLFIGAPLEQKLTFPPVDLRHHKGYRVRFEERHELRVDANRYRLEASTDGTNWSTLREFQGKSDWNRHEVDLGRFAGQELHLRIQGEPKSWDQGGPGDAFSISGLEVLGDDQVLYSDRARQLGPLIEAACKAGMGATPAESGERMEHLLHLAESLGNTREALALWPLLASHVGRPDLEAARTALEGLAAAHGGETAARLWPLLEGHPERAGLADLARQLVPRSGPDFAALERLVQAAPGQEAQQALRELEAAAPEVQAVGTFRRTEKGWSDQLFIGAPLEHSLTLPWLELSGVRQARLEFRQRHDLRVAQNVAGVEATTDGTHWVALDRYEGKGDWSTRSLELDDPRVQLRFRVIPKAWNQEGPGEALEVEDLRLKGVGLLGQGFELDPSELPQDARDLLLGIATDSQASAEERDTALRGLAALGAEETSAVLLQLAVARHQGLLKDRSLARLMSDFVGRALVGSDPRQALENALMDEPGRSGVREEDRRVVVGGVVVRKKREPLGESSGTGTLTEHPPKV
ncbi:MAG: hypothetical protein AB1758_09145, partial [Candidatus Eremiobacterota bacterium]